MADLAGFLEDASAGALGSSIGKRGQPSARSIRIAIDKDLSHLKQMMSCRKSGAEFIPRSDSAPCPLCVARWS